MDSVKPKLTPELAEEAIRLVKGGASNADVISYLGVAEGTFYAWLRDPQNDAQRALAQGLKKAETERKLWHLQRIHKAAEEGDWKASAWYLERRYPREYARTQRTIEMSRGTEVEDDALSKSLEELGKQM